MGSLENEEASQIPKNDLPVCASFLFWTSIDDVHA